jgi:hypothetical protein
MAMIRFLNSNSSSCCLDASYSLKQQSHSDTTHQRVLWYKSYTVQHYVKNNSCLKQLLQQCAAA